MANPLRAARGTTASLNSRVLLDGELAYNTTTEELHVGDGATAGGRPISSELDADDALVTATGSSTARTLADRANDSGINVMDYGAVGDGSTDDAEAIQDAIDAFRALISSAVTSSPVAPRLVFPSGKVFRVNDTLDFTSIRAFNAVVEFNGSCILGRCAGKPVIDLFNSRFLTFRQGWIDGHSTDTPTWGIQTAPVSADVIGEFTFDRFDMRGHFSKACFYGHACETSVYIGCHWFNSSDAVGSVPLAKPVVAVLDSLNTLGVDSEFEPTTLTPDTNRSFNQQTFVAVDFRKNSGASGSCVLLIGDSLAQIDFTSSYLVSNDKAAVETYKVGTIRGLNLDLHPEATGNNVLLLIDNVNPSGTVDFQRLRINTHAPAIDVALIDVTGATRNVVLGGADISVGTPTNSVPLIGPGASDATKVSINGVIRWPSTSRALDLSNCYFNGQIFIGVTTTFTAPAGGTFEIFRRPLSSTASTLVKQMKGRLGTTEGAADTLIFSAYDVNGTAFEDFFTLTANNTPTADLSKKVTMGSGGISRVLASQMTALTAHTGTTDVTTILTLALPTDCMGPNGWVDLELLWTCTGSTNAKTTRTHFGGTGVSAFASPGYNNASVTVIRQFFRISNQNSRSSQRFTHEANSQTTLNIAHIGSGTRSVDTSGTVDIVITAELASAGESIQLLRAIATGVYRE